MSIDGMKEFEAALAELSKSTAANVLKRSLKQAAQPMLAAAKRNAPVEGGDLEESLVLGEKLKRGDPASAGKQAYAAVMGSGGTKKAAQGALRAAQAQAGMSFAQLYLGPDLSQGKGSHAHLIEFGTGPRYHDDTGKFVGEVAPDPFLRPAFDAEAKPTMDRLGKILGAEIEKSAKRAARRMAKKRGWEV